ncbi:unnamed protein product [Bemisia tabaci]|uniref:Large ribosomal subunit protein mL43 n=1 Tax=Bemisia tabaci TaxID=7038 RepID=A0A9P0A0K0_BEMTA|nr:unnamed protein product [Bemisia tabaci]
MSNRHLFQQSGFVKAPFYNGFNRYVCQLKRITLKFCKEYGGSRGLRDFIEQNLVDFARENPQVVVYVKPRRHRSPVLVAEYLDGHREWMSLHNFQRDECYRWIHNMLTASGDQSIRYRKLWHTENPSIQGVWNPFTNRDPALNIATFPLKDMRRPANMPPTATELILEMAAQKEKMKELQTGKTEESKTEDSHV